MFSTAFWIRGSIFSSGISLWREAYIWTWCEIYIYIDISYRSPRGCVLWYGCKETVRWFSSSHRMVNNGCTYCSHTLRKFFLPKCFTPSLIHETVIYFNIYSIIARAPLYHRLFYLEFNFIYIQSVNSSQTIINKESRYI